MHCCRSACSEKSACSIASGGSSIGGNSTATLGNDYPSLTISDDFPADFLHDLEFTAVYGNLFFSPHKKIMGLIIIFESMVVLRSV